MMRLTGLFTYISRCGVQYRNQHLEPLGLTYRQADMMLKICNSPGISQDELGRRMVLNKSNIARQIAGLEEGGFVERRTDAKDKRAFCLYPTEKTLSIEPEIRQIFRDWNEYLMAVLTDEEQATLRELLSRVRDRAGVWLEENRNG